MKTRYSDSAGNFVSELAIVDTFTKLIFGDNSRYDDTELLIIQALRLSDDSVAVDDHAEMGAYLRALGIEEMISLVSRVQRQMASGHTRPPRRRDSGDWRLQRRGI